VHGGVHMPRALWKGSITAVRDSRPRFRLLHAEDRSPVGFERVCAREGKKAAWEELVKGHVEEVEPRQAEVVDLARARKTPTEAKRKRTA